MARCNDCDGDCAPCERCKRVEARAETIASEKRRSELELEVNRLKGELTKAKRRAENFRKKWTSWKKTMEIR